MSSFKNPKGVFIPVALLAVLVAGAFFVFGLTDTAPVQAAPLKGAIFTTTPGGIIVNENVRYVAKKDVYLDGGPRNAKASSTGLDDGLYVFQVTNPSGAMLLSEDASECRVVRVAGGVFTELVDIVPPNATFTVTGAHTIADVGSDFDDGCHINDVADADGVTGSDGQHDINTDDDGPSTDDIVVQLMPFADTPNSGGVYKALGYTRRPLP